MNRFELPNGFIHGEKKAKYVYLEEMTGKQQNYLINTEYKSPIEHVEPVLSELITKVETEEGEEIQEKKSHVVKHLLTIEDLQFILVKLRLVTFGKYFESKQECSHCKAENNCSIDLEVLEVLPPEEDKPLLLKLPKLQEQVEFKPLTFSDLKKYSTDPKRLMNKATTSTAAMIVKRIGDNENVKEEDIEKLKALDIRTIQREAPQYNHIDIHFDHKCHSCEKDFDYDLEVISSDFLLL